MRNRMRGGVRGRETKVGRKLLRFPPTRFCWRPSGDLFEAKLFNVDLLKSRGIAENSYGFLIEKISESVAFPFNA